MTGGSIQLRTYRIARRTQPMAVAATMAGIEIAEALGINDSRFLPAYYFHEPTPPGRVVFFVSGRKDDGK